MADFEDFWMTAQDGVRLHARDYRNDGAPFTVLCLHGLSRNAADFEDLAAVLAPRYRVVVMEQRGRGESGWDPVPANYHLGTYVRDTTDLLDALGLGDVAVIGTSMGGLMGMAMGSATPERFRGLVLNDIGPVVEAAGLARIQGYVGRGAPVDSWADAVAAVRAISEVAFPDLDAAQWEAFARRLYRMRADGRLELAYDPAIAEPMNADTGAAVPPDLWSLFDGLSSLPVLVIRGALSDILAAQTVAEMARRHSQLRHVEVPQVGHAPLLSEPAALGAIEAFLADLED